MPIIKSAIKRVRQTSRRTRRNLIVKTRYKELIKQFQKLITDGKKADATKLFPLVQKSIDMAVKKNLLHSKTAGRRKSSLAKDLAGQKPEAKKAAPAKKEEKKEVKKES